VAGQVAGRSRTALARHSPRRTPGTAPATLSDQAANGSDGPTGLTPASFRSDGCRMRLCGWPGSSLCATGYRAAIIILGTRNPPP